MLIDKNRGESKFVSILNELLVAEALLVEPPTSREDVPDPPVKSARTSGVDRKNSSDLTACGELRTTPGLLCPSRDIKESDEEEIPKVTNIP